MKQRVILFQVVLLVACTVFAAAETTLSVGDFAVNSDNIKYRYIGKGLSRMVAGELRKADTIAVIEREKLNTVLEEQQLGLTGLIDEHQQLELGRLLSANYIVVGEIFDMAGSILTTIRLVDATTGEVSWQDELIKPLAAYDFISSYFAAGIIAFFNVEMDTSTERKIKAEEVKSEEAILALSAGIDAYDRNDKEEARQSLNRARVADPDNETARFFLNKLTANTAKFRIIGESYYALENPAYLGELKTDKIYMGVAYRIPIYDNRGAQSRSWMPMEGGWYFDEGDTRIRLGYSWPLVKEKTGMSLEAFFSQSDDHYGDESNVYLRSLGHWYTGGTVGTGWSFPGFSLGGTFSLFYETNLGFAGPGSDKIQEVSFAVDTGALLHSQSGIFTYGIRIGWSNADFEQVTDLVANTLDQYVSVPLFWENSFDWELNSGRTFLVVKNINDFYLEDGNLFLRLLPLTEHFFTNRLSLRGGLEGSVSIVDGAETFGYGILGGVTLRIPKSGWDFDVNITYRQRPSRIYNQYLYNTMPVSFMVTKEGLFFRD